MAKYIVYATFKTTDGEAMMDSATCTIHHDGAATVAAGAMTRISGGTFFYPFEYEQAGTYFARCTGFRGGQNNMLFTHIFEIVEDIRPHYLNVEPIESLLNAIQDKIGDRYDDSIEGLLHELTSYSTGTTPLPYLHPVTALNCKFSIMPDDNAMVVDKNGIGITGAKVTFTPSAAGAPDYVTFTRDGYWGVYVPADVYTVRIETAGGVFEDEMEVLP